ncbi:hypothetical protein PVL29_003892 [Vitis rotundifolia]|uniref:Uncharacterized protein n=1 Tax=Vitis rotundifolia TaxID=103349 RepID=A0AA39A6G7_VITRO|nr:hypothetical protein PVL29_003892 [Vitis rotundifolia]
MKFMAMFLPSFSFEINSENVQKPVSHVSLTPDDHQLLTCGVEDAIKCCTISFGECPHIYEKPVLALYPMDGLLMGNGCLMASLIGTSALGLQILIFADIMVSCVGS